jgi:hypothetical protein
MSGGYSYNGWPASDSASAINVNTKWSVNGITAPGGMKSGDVDTVMAYLFNALDSRVEEAVPGWCWGWNYRANANNPNNLSNHSSATALDYNAPNHPNGGSQYEGWSSSQVATIRTILNEELEGCIEWGADYSGTKDSMHFDVEVDADRLAELATKIRNLEGNMGLTADDKDWLESAMHSIAAKEINDALTKDLLVSTDDEAADGNPNKYTIASGIARDIRLTSFAATGQVLKPH